MIFVVSMMMISLLPLRILGVGGLEEEYALVAELSTD
jgi:hypothetical protein